MNVGGYITRPNFWINILWYVLNAKNANMISDMEDIDINYIYQKIEGMKIITEFYIILIMIKKKAQIKKLLKYIK